MLNQKTEANVIEEISNNNQFENIEKAKNPFLTFYGSKLFLKCFGWFIFITLVNIILVATFIYIYHYKPTKKEFEVIASRILENNGLLMAETYEKKGNLYSAKFRGPGNFWLFDDSLNILFDGTEKIENNKKLKNNASNYLPQSPFFNHRNDRHTEFDNPPPPKPMDDIHPENRFEINSFYPFKPKPHILPNKFFKLKNNRNASFTPYPNVFKEKELDEKPDNTFIPPNVPPELGKKRNPTIELKPPHNNLLRLKYNSFYKNNKNKLYDFAKSLLNKIGTSILIIDEESFFGCQLLSDSGKKYVAVIHIPREMPNQNKALLFAKAKYMLPLLIFVCATLCFIMARNLAKPIVELQEASRKFAKGDFSQKITKNAMSRYDEIGDLAVDFNNMAERIEAGINSQKRLFHDISHELRSPLARMQVAIELLQIKVSDSEKSLVNRLDKDVARMNALIAEILQFSKLENKEIGLIKEEINLGKTLENVCADAEFEGNNKHKGVRLEIKDNCMIKGNSALIERAFENIIRNGLRFTPENSVVEVSLEKITNKAVIKIGDSGPGIPENQLEKVFAPFYCIKEDRNPQSGGIGLGLPIALKTVQIHNGNIKITNKTEGGLLVTIELPIE